MPTSRCCDCPAEDDPPPGVLARLVEELEADEDRSVVPVRVFWVPGGLPTRSKVVGAAVGPRHLPPAGAAAAPHPAQGPVARPGGRRRTREGVRTAPAVERHHGRRKPQGIRAIRASAARAWRSNASNCGCSGPEYKSPRLIKPEMLASARFREGLEQIPGATVEKAGEMLDELVDRVEPVLGRPDPVTGPRDLQPGLRPEHRLRPHRGRVDAARAGNPPRGAAVLAPVLPRRRDRAGGDAGEPAAAGAHVRGHQPVVRRSWGR